MAHRAARQRKARRLGHRRAVARADRPQRPHRADAVGRHVGAGEHGDDAGQRLRPPRRRCARMRACACGERTSTQCNAPGSVDVGDEAAAAEQEARILDAAHRRADAFDAKRCRRARRSIAVPRAAGRAARTPTLSETMNRSASPPLGLVAAPRSSAGS